MNIDIEMGKNAIVNLLQVVFGIESVIGGFLMAAFVAVFTRKFMR